MTGSQRTPGFGASHAIFQVRFDYGIFGGGLHGIISGGDDGSVGEMVRMVMGSGGLLGEGGKGSGPNNAVDR